MDFSSSSAEETQCPIEAPPGLMQMSQEALAAAKLLAESGTFRPPPGLEAPPGLELVKRHTPPPGFAARTVVKKEDDDDSSDKSTDAEGSGSGSIADSMNSPIPSLMNPYAKEFQSQAMMNPDAKEFVPPARAKSKQTLNLSHAILVPEEEEDNEDAYYKKESSKYKGRFYYVHKKTGATTWKAPKKKVQMPKTAEVAKPKKESEIAAEALSQEISKTMSQLSSSGKTSSLDDNDGNSTDAGVEQSGESDFDSDFSRSSLAAAPECSKNILPSLGKLMV